MKNHYEGREIARAVHGWTIEKEIQWEIDQLETEIDDHEWYCDNKGLPYDDAEEKARLVELRKELKEIRG